MNAVLGALLLSVLLGGGGGYRLLFPFWQPPTAAKLGLAGGTPEQAQVIGATWYYDWGTRPLVPAEGGIEAVPMLWGAEQVGQPVGGNSRWLLGFNEPDLGIQANLTPEQGAYLWRKVETLYHDKLLVAPAPSDAGRYWLVQMRQAYHERYGTWPRFDALAMHCYRWNAAECIAIGKEFATWVHDWGVPEVWITEFSFVRAWAANPEYEARMFLAWAHAEPLVTRLAPYTAHAELGAWYWPDTRDEADPSLFTGPQSLVLTAVGRWYQERR